MESRSKREFQQPNSQHQILDNIKSKNPFKLHSTKLNQEVFDNSEDMIRNNTDIDFDKRVKKSYISGKNINSQSNFAMRPKQARSDSISPTKNVSSAILFPISKIKLVSYSNLDYCSLLKAEDQQGNSFTLRIYSYHFTDHIMKEGILAELYILQKLKNHKNIIQLIDYYVEEDQTSQQSHTYILFEAFNWLTLHNKLYSVDLKDGRSSIDKYSDRSALSLSEVWKILLDILSALKVLHAIGYTHRNVRPENIILAKDNTYKLGNFLYSSPKSYDYIESELRNELNFEYSKNSDFYYMSPEELNIQSDRPIGNKVDVFSLGLIAYEMFYNVTIFRFHMEKQLDEKDINSHLLTTRKDAECILDKYSNIYDTIKQDSGNTRLNDSIRNFLLKMLNENPKERYSVDDLLNFIKLNRQYLGINENLGISEEEDYVFNTVKRDMSKLKQGYEREGMIANTSLNMGMDCNSNSYNMQKKNQLEFVSQASRNSRNNIKQESLKQSKDINNENIFSKIELSKRSNCNERVKNIIAQVFKRRSTYFLVLKLTNEDPKSCPQLNHMKILIEKSHRAQDKEVKFFDSIKRRPIHYLSFVALKSIYSIHHYIYLSGRQLMQKVNIEEYLTFFINVWKLRMNNNYEIDDWLKDASITKFIVLYAELVESKVSLLNRYNFIEMENNFSIFRLASNLKAIRKEEIKSPIKAKALCEQLLNFKFVSDLISYMRELVDLLSDLPLHSEDIFNTIEVVIQISNEEICCLFNLLFVLFVAMYFKSTNFPEYKQLNNLTENDLLLNKLNGKEIYNIISEEDFMQLFNDYYNAIKDAQKEFKRIEELRISKKSKFVLFPLPTNFLEVFEVICNEWRGRFNFIYFLTSCLPNNSIHSAVKIHLPISSQIELRVFDHYSFNNKDNASGIAKIMLSPYFDMKNQRLHIEQLLDRKNKIEVFQSDETLLRDLENRRREDTHKSKNDLHTPRPNYNQDLVHFENPDASKTHMVDIPRQPDLNFQKTIKDRKAVDELFDNESVASFSGKLKDQIMTDKKDIQFKIIENIENTDEKDDFSQCQDIETKKERISLDANNFLRETFSENNIHWFIRSSEVTLEKQIGFGGSSEVFLGQYRRCDVAVKRIKALEVNKENLKEFKREVATLTILRHPNLVLFMGAIAEPDNISIVTEYCAGGTLFHLLHIHKHIPLSWELRMKILFEIAIGMNFLHTNQPSILHRDLKSLNILLTEKVEKKTDVTRIKISDFGLSKIINHLDPNKEMMTGMLGTCHWMPPEVIENKEYTLKADVYSYGIIIWECLCRVTPYADMSQQQISYHVVAKKLRPDCNLIPEDAPKCLLMLMERCWDQGPDNRPSFDQICTFLKKCLKI